MAKAHILILILLPPLFFAIAAPAWACLWYYGKNVKGQDVSLMGLEGTPQQFMAMLTDFREHQYAQGIDTSKEPDPKGDYKLRSDYAATLVHQGRAAKAIPILEDIEKAHPNEYVIAVNLGTAYELAGDNDKALYWIQEGIRRNPNSHMGTEWLHLEILEAKIAAAKDPDWIKAHTVLDLDFGAGDIPERPISRLPKGQSPESVRSALFYQLHERLAFVPPPDPLVGGMIADLGDLCGLQMSADHAVALYDLALTYHPLRAELITRRRAQALKFVGQIVSQASLERRRGNVALAVAGLLILSAVILYVVQKRKKPGVPVSSGQDAA